MFSKWVGSNTKGQLDFEIRLIPVEVKNRKRCNFWKAIFGFVVLILTFVTLPETNSSHLSGGQNPKGNSFCDPGVSGGSSVLGDDFFPPSIMFLYTQGGFFTSCRSHLERENISQKQLAVCRFCRVQPECSNSSLRLNFYNPQFSTNAPVVCLRVFWYPARTELLSWLNGSFQCLGFEFLGNFRKTQKKGGDM